MSTTPQEDWRAEAIRNMEMTDGLDIAKPEQSASLGMVFAKIALVIALAVPLIWFGGFEWLFAVGLVTWYLFWPR